MALCLRLFNLRHATDSAPLSKDRSGVAALEFALVAPIFIALLMGIVTYGSYFLTAHTIQQIANDSARASIAGMDDGERKTIVDATVDAEISSYPFLKGKIKGVDVNRTDATVSVRVTYDGAEDIWTQLLVPAPSPTIVRDAVIRLGGY
ncbi:MAG: TadE/TadG family type IV pilus assembly protein [Caulobacterales bacterium]